MTSRSNNSNEFDDFFGKEKVKELNADMEFLLNNFNNLAERYVLSATFKMVTTNDDAEQIASLMSIYYAALIHYRDWLAERGIDVLELEGRK